MCRWATNGPLPPVQIVCSGEKNFLSPAVQITHQIWFDVRMRTVSLSHVQYLFIFWKSYIMDSYIEASHMPSHKFTPFIMYYITHKNITILLPGASSPCSWNVKVFKVIWCGTVLLQLSKLIILKNIILMFQDIYYNKLLSLNIFIPSAEITIMNGYLNCFNWSLLPLPLKYRTYMGTRYISDINFNSCRFCSASLQFCFLNACCFAPCSTSVGSKS